MDRLINEPFHSMHRVLDMLCLNFGKTYREEKVSIGNKVVSYRVFPAYSLHVQVQWRFVFQDRILLGSRDIYKPFSKEVQANWDFAPIGRSDSESSIFDVVSKHVANALNGEHITHCKTSPVGDIRIEFSNGYIFEVFIPASYPGEEWRLVDFLTNTHLIFHDID